MIFWKNQQRRKRKNNLKEHAEVALGELVVECNQYAVGNRFWRFYETELPITTHVNTSIICQKLLLIDSEVAEAMEFMRTPEFSIDNLKPLMEELCDIVIRTMDLAGQLEEHQSTLAVQVDDYAQFARTFKLKVLANRKRPPMHGKRF